MALAHAQIIRRSSISLESRRTSYVFTPCSHSKEKILNVHCMQDEIFGSAYAAAVYLSTVINFPKDKKVFVIGMEGLEEELANEGISFIGGTVCILHQLFIILSIQPH